VWVQSLANQTTVPYVISTSYGDDETSVDPDYANRLEQEFQKAGVRGISMLFSSGDSGVGCNTRNQFEPTLPATLPSVTAVGSTGLTSNSAMTEQASYFSIGGFANYFAMPDYQMSAVMNYLNTYASSLPNSSYYNASGRAFPDVAALGENFPIVVGGGTIPVDGTSCSSPTFAGILATLIDARLAAGKSSLGFLNPLIYQHPEVFNDIVKGNNPGCNTNGFPAEKGWDPVTGMGTPNYPAMAKLIDSLP
jgi:tripeptidyl-peptidase-1